MTAVLYSYFRSSAAWRARIALAWKSVPVSIAPVNLRGPDGGEQRSPEFLALNPQGLVPCLVEDGHVIAQSTAICEYLEERYPTPPLMPASPLERARVRALAQAIACDIHPLDNLRVLQYLRHRLGHTQDQIDEWYRHWIEVGFRAIEAGLEQLPGARYCCGSAVTLADVFLVPQVANARRVNLDLAPFPRIRDVEQRLLALPAFADTAPTRQPDYSEA
jgi:maleylacetoacetate isomerase